MRVRSEIAPTGYRLREGVSTAPRCSSADRPSLLRARVAGAQRHTPPWRGVGGGACRRGRRHAAGDRGGGVEAVVEHAVAVVVDAVAQLGRRGARTQVAMPPSTQEEMVRWHAHAAGRRHLSFVDLGRCSCHRGRCRSPHPRRASHTTELETRSHCLMPEQVPASLLLVQGCWKSPRARQAQLATVGTHCCTLAGRRRPRRSRSGSRWGSSDRTRSRGRSHVLPVDHQAVFGGVGQSVSATQATQSLRRRLAGEPVGGQLHADSVAGSRTAAAHADRQPAPRRHSRSRSVSSFSQGSPSCSWKGPAAFPAVAARGEDGDGEEESPK